MNRSTNPAKSIPVKKNTNGIKALIMTASIAMTVGGWGVLATQQVQGAVANVPSAQLSSQTAAQAVSSTGSTTTLNNTRNAAAPVRSVARTRSSR